jgi:hypothetical protein
MALEPYSWVQFARAFGLDHIFTGWPFLLLVVLLALQLGARVLQRATVVAPATATTGGRVAERVLAPAGVSAERAAEVLSQRFPRLSARRTPLGYRLERAPWLEVGALSVSAVLVLAIAAWHGQRDGAAGRLSVVEGDDAVPGAPGGTATVASDRAYLPRELGVQLACGRGGGLDEARACRATSAEGTALGTVAFGHPLRLGAASLSLRAVGRAPREVVDLRVEDGGLAAERRARVGDAFSISAVPAVSALTVGTEGGPDGALVWMASPDAPPRVWSGVASGPASSGPRVFAQSPAELTFDFHRGAHRVWLWSGLLLAACAAALALVLPHRAMHVAALADGSVVVSLWSHNRPGWALTARREVSRALAGALAQPGAPTEAS